MAFSAEPVLGLINDGRFQDALSELQKTHVRPEDPERETYVSLLANSLHLTGQTEAAERLAQQICKIRTARPSTLARCHLVLGSICRDRGDLRRSVWHSEKAFTFAEDGQNPELACWARLRLMMVKGETDGAEAAIGMLPEIRRRVASLGNPTLLATLHLWVAEFESKRGLLASATRHIHMGRAILRRHHNVWLEGSAAIDDFCVAFLKSNVEAAFSFASQALAAASLSGHAATRMAACTNLAHIYLTYGEFEKAKDYFDEALGCCQSGGANQVAVLDGLAQLEMARCNFSKCEEYLDQIEGFRETVSSHAPGYYQSWSFHTKLQLLVTQQRIDEAQELVKSLRPVFDRFHPSLRLGLRRLHAELLLVNRDYCAASGVLHKAYSDCDRQSPEAFAYISLTIGKTLVSLDLPSVAAFHLRRSIRIFDHLKQAAAANEAAAAFSRIPTNLIEPVSEQAFAVTEGQVKYTDQRDSIRGRRENVLDQIAGLIELEEAPELLGQEVIELFRQLDCTERLVLVRNAATRREVIACDGDSSDLADNHVGTAELELHVGTDENNILSVLAIPRANLLSQLDCAAAFKVVAALVELRTLRREAQERHAIWPADEAVPTEEVVFAAAPMVEMLRTLRKIAPSNVTVLITGETGTGKEVFARALHQYSNRAEKLFTAFNCAAVPRDLIESQLFGYRRGAFSGAHDGFEGVVRASSGGSLFLDEIGEIPHDIQPKLLRFLESNEVHPLGEPKPFRIDVRVIAATNANLEQSVARGLFREDLFYRLNVVRFRIPPLRERREEIPRLVRHFLHKYSEEYFKSGLSVSDQVMECLLLYGWPGNIRQLANEMRRLVALADHDAILSLNDLSPELTADLRVHPQHYPTKDTELSVSLNQPLNSAVEQLERAMLRHALSGSQWRVDTAAKVLGLSRKGLYLKRMRLGMAELGQ